MAFVDFLTENAVISVIVIGFLVTFLSSLVIKFCTNQERMKELKKRQKELNDKVRELQKKGDFAKIEELNKEVLDVSMELMKVSFSGKQFLLTSLPLLFLFVWLKKIFVPVLGTKWLWIYLGSSLVSSFLSRKILKMA